MSFTEMTVAETKTAVPESVLKKMMREDEWAIFYKNQELQSAKELNAANRTAIYTWLSVSVSFSYFSNVRKANS